MDEPFQQNAAASHRRTILRAYAALLVGNICLAFGPWLVRLADVTPIASGFWRLALGAPFLFLLTRITRQPIPRMPVKLLGILALGGVCFAADLGSWHSGIVQTKLANSTLFGNIAAFLLPICGFIAARRLPGKLQAIAFLLAIAGMMLMLGRSYELSAQYLRGDLLCIVAGVLYTAYFLCMTRARGTLEAMPALLVSTIAGMGPLLLFALAAGGPIMPQNWGPVILLAIGSQVLGQGLLVYAIGALSPLVMGLGLLIQPFVAAAIGSIRYGEPLGLADVIGGLAICIALVLVRIDETGKAAATKVDSAP